MTFRESCSQTTSEVDKVSLPLQEGTSSLRHYHIFIIVILYVTYITAGPALADVTQGFLRWSAAYLVCRRMTLTDHPFYCVFDFFYKKLLISIYNNLKPINIVDEVGPK